MCGLFWFSETSSSFSWLNHPTFFLQSFQKEITLNTERIDGLIVFGEGLIQKSSPQDAALIEDELEELHSYCQEVFSRLVRFHQRLSQPPVSWRTHILPFMTWFMQFFQTSKSPFFYSLLQILYCTFVIQFKPVDVSFVEWLLGYNAASHQHISLYILAEISDSDVNVILTLFYIVILN